MKIAPLVAAVSKQNFHHAKVLVIDDDPQELAIICQNVSKHLSEVEVIGTDNQDWAVAYLVDHKLDEWKLPKMILLVSSAGDIATQWQVLNAIKAISTLVSQIPVVTISETEEVNDVREAYEHGVASYLIKPKSDEEWSFCFQMMRVYWWETVSLPSSRY